MSGRVRIRLARALGRHLVRVMPERRADWALGMRAEIEAIDDPGQALSFALGCVRTGYERRLRTLSGTLTAMRWSIAAAVLMFAVMVLTNGYWSLTQGLASPLPVVFGALGLAFLVAALTLGILGPRGLAVIAAVMLTINTAGLWLTNQGGLLHGDVYRALVVEGYLLWSALLLVGLTLSAASRSPRLTAWANARGWDG